LEEETSPKIISKEWQLKASFEIDLHVLIDGNDRQNLGIKLIDLQEY